MMQFVAISVSLFLQSRHVKVAKVIALYGDYVLCGGTECLGYHCYAHSPMTWRFWPIGPLVGRITLKTGWSFQKNGEIIYIHKDVLGFLFVSCFDRTPKATQL